jgi:hypothetical protein
MESPITKWNSPEQNGIEHNHPYEIAHNQMESPITKWNRPEPNGTAHNQMESPLMKALKTKWNRP